MNTGANAFWLKTIVRRAARQMEVQIDDRVVEFIAHCSLITPMDTIRRLQFVADFAKGRQRAVTADLTALALQSFAQRERASAFEDFVGQERIKKRIQLAIDALEHNNQPPGHILLTGPSGSGKTTLAPLIADRIANALDTLVKPVAVSEIRQAGDLAGLLTNLEENDLLLLDNIDLLTKAISDYLEPALADFKLDITIDDGPDARPVRLNLPQFTLIATATNKKRLSPMLQACFTIDEELDAYSATELAEIVRCFARSVKLEIDETATDLVVRSVPATPKNILDLIQYVRVFAKNKKSSHRITAEIVTDALKLLPENENVAGLNGGRQAIPSAVRREVWRRDGGKCAKCGSREDLEYDHIIPIAKGGSNTVRNIELLCEICNRSKSDTIQ